MARSLPPLADIPLSRSTRIVSASSVAGAEAAVPNYEPTMADSVGAAARAQRGVPVMEALPDAPLADEGRAFFALPCLPTTA